jgi:hypothetical protein
LVASTILNISEARNKRLEILKYYMQYNSERKLYCLLKDTNLSGVLYKSKQTILNEKVAQKFKNDFLKVFPTFSISLQSEHFPVDFMQ